MVFPLSLFKVLASSHVTALVQVPKNKERSLDLLSDGLNLRIVTSDSVMAVYL